MTTPTTTTTAAPTVEPTVEAITAVPLTLADRCCATRSGTEQAFVRVSLIDEDGKPGEILLCHHHYVQHETTLATRATVTGIQDERGKINKKPSQSSV